MEDECSSDCWHFSGGALQLSLVQEEALATGVRIFSSKIFRRLNGRYIDSSAFEYYSGLEIFVTSAESVSDLERLACSECPGSFEHLENLSSEVVKYAIETSEEIKTRRASVRVHASLIAESQLC